jgi:hypothetical protein
MTIEEETAAHWRPVLEGAMALFTDPGTPPSEPHDPVPAARQPERRSPCFRDKGKMHRLRPLHIFLPDGSPFFGS